jgi:hypothetical protein
MNLEHEKNLGIVLIDGYDHKIILEKGTMLKLFIGLNL